MSKNVFVFVAVLCLDLAVAGCGGHANPGTTPAASPAQGAVVTHDNPAALLGAAALALVSNDYEISTNEAGDIVTQERAKGSNDEVQWILTIHPSANSVEISGTARNENAKVRKWVNKFVAVIEKDIKLFLGKETAEDLVAFSSRIDTMNDVVVISTPPDASCERVDALEIQSCEAAMVAFGTGSKSMASAKKARRLAKVRATMKNANYVFVESETPSMSAVSVCTILMGTAYRCAAGSAQ